MVKNILFYSICLVGLGLIFFYTFSEGEDSYKLNIAKYRTQYEFSLKTSNGTPLEDKAKFTGLEFFPVDDKFLVDAKLELIEDYKTIELQTNNKTPHAYRYFGELSFSIDSIDLKLILLQNTEDQTDFFLPFFDETNGEETYGGGRYVPVEISKNNIVTLDFNLAFNPYCTYNKDYICPIPPKENALPIAINVGEKYKASYY